LPGPARIDPGRRLVCDLKAYARKNGKEELLLEAVNQVRAEGGEVVLRNLFGEEKRVQGVVKEVSLAKNRVIVEQS
jgi:predicted RNA-binding protein